MKLLRNFKLPAFPYGGRINRGEISPGGIAPMTPRARRILRQSIAFVSSTITLGTALSQVRAFPEAEGFGAYTTGARTNLAAATVYHVTNLNDSGAGSFRDAVSASNRFVVFDVSGVANLLTPVSVKNNVTIAGQTAPGGGFTLYGAKVSYTIDRNLHHQSIERRQHDHIARSGSGRCAVRQ